MKSSSTSWQPLATASAIGSPTSPLRRSILATASDLFALTKPGIVAMCAISTAAGVWLAQTHPGLLTVLGAMLGTCLAVGGANALNMYVERDLDRRMHRTAQRPLAARRLGPRVGLAFGLALAAAGLIVLALLANPLSALLAALALSTYVLLYTPLKRVTHLALVVGAIPGAMPALIGWAASTGTINAAGLLLFGTIVLWQVPHVLAIALFRGEDYARAGFPMLQPGRGERLARRSALLCTALLVPESLLVVHLGATGNVYALVAGLAGAYLLLSGLSQLRAARGRRGARRFFRATLFYLPLVALGLWLNTVFP